MTTIFWGLRKINGGWVSNSGAKKSYTNSTKTCRRFNSKEDAESNACGNELAIQIRLEE